MMLFIGFFLFWNLCVNVCLDVMNALVYVMMHFHVCMKRYKRACTHIYIMYSECIYICIYVHIYIVCMYIYIYMYVYVYIYILCIYVYTVWCWATVFGVPMHMRMYVYIYIWVDMCLYINKCLMRVHCLYQQVSTVHVSMSPSINFSIQPQSLSIHNHVDIYHV